MYIYAYITYILLRDASYNTITMLATHMPSKILGPYILNSNKNLFKKLQRKTRIL